MTYIIYDTWNVYINDFCNFEIIKSNFISLKGSEMFSEDQKDLFILFMHKYATCISGADLR